MSAPGAKPTGRGAWTKVGKPNGRRYYCLVDGIDTALADGAQPQLSPDHEAVHLAVRAVQYQLNVHLPTQHEVKVTGRFGLATRIAAQRAQQSLGLAADGVVGPVTVQAMWRPVVRFAAGYMGFPAEHLWGILMKESLGDPGAVGALTPADRGLFQLNTAVHRDVTLADAHQTIFATQWTADRIRIARQHWSDKGADLQTRCSIAQHNAPSWAADWYATGEPPNERIADYVNDVLELGASL